MGILKKLAGDSAIYGLSSIVGRFLNYLLVPLHTNVFSDPGQYGAVTEIYAYISFLLIVFTYGMETAFFHFSNKYPDHKNRVFATGTISLLVSTIIFSGGIILYSDTISGLLDYKSNPEYIIWMALILGFDALTAVPFARLRQQGRSKKFAALKLFGIGVNIFFNVLFFLVLPVWFKSEEGFLYSIALKIYNPDTGAGYVFISNMFASLLTLIAMSGSFRIKIADFDFRLWKESLLYAAPLLVAGMAGMINETLDRVLIRHLVADGENAIVQLGIYGACYKLSILMTLFIQAFRYAAEPFFFSQFGKKDAGKNYALVTKYFTITCSIVFLGVMMYIDVFKYFIGPAYRSGMGVVPILLLANMCLGIFFNLSMWYKMTGKTSYGIYFTLFGAAITITLNVILVPLMGYMGAAWATLGCYFLMMVASYITGQIKYPVPYETAKILKYIFIAIALYLVSLIFEKYVEPGAIIRYTFNTLCLAGYLYYLSRVERPPVNS